MSLIYGYSVSEEDDTSLDSSQIEKNKSDIKKLKAVKIKESTGSFIAPTNDGKVEITGWSMSDNNTVIAVLLKAKSSLMASPMQLSDMKLGRSAILFTGRNPKHNKMFVNTRGNAVGTVVERTVDVKFVYIDHTDDSVIV